ncbi:hypothetical protein MMC25_004652 [Agyrium rufum]|nr:hypothetical protein [Agyrium rufum]
MGYDGLTAEELPPLAAALSGKLELVVTAAWVLVIIAVGLVEGLLVEELDSCVSEDVLLCVVLKAVIGVAAVGVVIEVGIVVLEAEDDVPRLDDDKELELDEDDAAIIGLELAIMVPDVGGPDDEVELVVANTEIEVILKMVGMLEVLGMLEGLDGEFEEIVKVVVVVENEVVVVVKLSEDDDRI